VGVLDQPSTRLDEALLETGQRPALDSPRQHEPPLEVLAMAAVGHGQSTAHGVRRHASGLAAHHRGVLGVLAWNTAVIFGYL
jgi:hypothetical protein